MKICSLGSFGIKINPLLLLMMIVWIISGYWSTALVIFILLVLHEMAHGLVAAAFNVRLYEMELLPFGASIKMENIFEGHPIKETLIAIAGPLVSVICAISACAFRYYFPNVLQNEMLLAEQYGYLIACFNFIPALPLDGGRVFRAVLSRRCDFGRATRITSLFGMLVGFVMIAWGIYTIIIRRPNILLSLLGLFLVFSAFEQYKQGRFELARCILNRQKTQCNCQSLYVKELAIKEDMRLSGVLRLLKDDNKFYIFKVLDKNMQVKGSFDEQMLQQEMIRRKNDCTAGEILVAK